MTILLPINSGHAGILKDRIAQPYGLYGDCRYLFSSAKAPIGLIDLRTLVPFSGSIAIGADASGTPTVNNNEAQEVRPVGQLFSLGSILTQSPLAAGPGEWRELFSGVAPGGNDLPIGDAPYLSYINAKYDGTLIGACFQNDVLYLLEWTITPPTYTGVSVATPGHATAVVLDTISTAPADKPGHVWHEIDESGPVIYFTGVLTGKLYRWDGSNLTLDGTVGAGADVITEQNGQLIIAGTNFIKRRTGAGVYVNIMPTGVLSPPALTNVGGLGYHTSGSGTDFGGINTGTHVFTPTCALVTDSGDVYIAGSVWQTSLNAVSHSIIFKVTTTDCVIVALRAGTSPSSSSALFGVMGIGEAFYQFDDASLDTPSSTLVAGTSKALLQTRIIGISTSFLSDFAIGDRCALTNGGSSTVLSIESDEALNVATPIGNGKDQTITRVRQVPVSAAGNKVFFLDVGGNPATTGSYSYPGGAGTMLGMFDPTTDRWYWNRMIAVGRFDQDPLTITRSDWRVGSMLPFNGDVVYTQKAQYQGETYFVLWRVYMNKHFPVDANTTGWERDYIFPPAGDQGPNYNGGYYQWWTPLGNTLAGQASPVRGGLDRFVAVSGCFGRDIIALNDNGTVA